MTSVHLAPKGLRMKNRALRVTGTHLDALHRHVPGDAVVLAGDLNITRCQHPPLRGEKATCAIRPGHRALLDSGYRDAVHSQNFTGPTGVVGVANRIDFLYTKGEVTASWHDRCYRAHFVRQWRCDASQAVFASPTRFRRCEARHLFHGRPGNGCPPTMFRRYYSDHPVLATVLR